MAAALRDILVFNITVLGAVVYLCKRYWFPLLRFWWWSCALKNAASVKRTLFIALVDTQNNNFGKQQNTCLFLPLTVEMTVNLLLGVVLFILLLSSLVMMLMFVSLKLISLLSSAFISISKPMLSVVDPWIHWNAFVISVHKWVWPILTRVWWLMNFAKWALKTVSWSFIFVMFYCFSGSTPGFCWSKLLQF